MKRYSHAGIFYLGGGDCLPRPPGPWGSTPLGDVTSLATPISGTSSLRVLVTNDSNPAYSDTLSALMVLVKAKYAASFRDLFTDH